MKCNVCQKNICDLIENEIDDSNLYNLIKEHLEECTNCKELYNKKIKEKEALNSEFSNTNLKFTNENEVMSSINLNYYNNSFANKFNFHLRKFKIRYISCVLFILLAIYLTPIISTNSSYFINLLHSKNNNSPVTNTENIVRSDDYLKNIVSEIDGVDPQKITKLENEKAEGKNIRVFSDNIYNYKFYDDGNLRHIGMIDIANYKVKNELSIVELKQNAVNILKKIKKDNFILSKESNAISANQTYILDFREKDNNINTGSYISISLWPDGSIKSMLAHYEPKLSPTPIKKLKISKEKALKIIFKDICNDTKIQCSINLYDNNEHLLSDIKNSKLSPDKYSIERDVQDGIPVWIFKLKSHDGGYDIPLAEYTISAIDGHIVSSDCAQ